jgi:hypothetical protein
MGWKNPPRRSPRRADTHDVLSERHVSGHDVDKQAADAVRIARRMLDYGEPRPAGANGGHATGSNRPSIAERQMAPRMTVRLAFSAWWTITVARLVLLLSPSSRAARSAEGAPGMRPAGPEHSTSPAGVADARAGFGVPAGVDTTGP